MVFFTVVLYVLLFALCLGAIISVIVYVPLFIYTIPYIWQAGERKLKEEATFMQTVKNARAFYKSKKLAKKLAKQEPNV